MDAADIPLSELISRLKAQQRGVPARPRTTAPQLARATEALVDSTDIPHHQVFGEKSRQPGACNDEGWYWTPAAGNGGDFPWSVWCGRPKGHPGPHEARTGFTLRRHQIRVLQWGNRRPEA
jgi:hypothetical protein